MNFNPFKMFGRKKTELLGDKDKNAVASDAAAQQQPVTDAAGKKLRGSRLRRAQVSALVARHQAAENIADMGERLFEYQQIDAASKALIEKYMNNKMGWGTFFGGLGMFGASIATLNPILATSGIFMMGTGIGLSSRTKQFRRVLSTALAEDRNAMNAVIVKSQAAIDEIVNKGDLAQMARSVRFDDVVKAYPVLKDRFLLAAARDKVIQDSEPKKKPEPDQPKGPIF